MPGFNAICLLVCAALVMGGCDGGDTAADTKFSAKSAKLDDLSVFADVISSGPTTLPNGKTATFVAYSVGPLSLPSGQIVAADGLVMPPVKPFTRRVRPGSYPVTVAVARVGRDQRIAFAQIRFSERRVARWEMAVTSDVDAATIKAGARYAYSVDSGTGSFADLGAREILSARDSRKLLDQAIAEMKKVYEPTRSWVVIDTPKGSAALFSSGWGDGGYASYFGVDENGEPAALVTDFEVIDWTRP